MSTNDRALYAHLMRRAGFGAGAAEIDELAKRPYEEVVEDLLHPENYPDRDTDVLERYFARGRSQQYVMVDWLYKMVNSGGPLREKMALFYHHVFATSTEKGDHHVYRQIERFRELALSDFRTMLAELSRDPAMLMWLDNNENFSDAPNENYGRELLELFSMGVGNYTEEDVKACAYAFTGWSFRTPIFRPNYEYATEFLYKDDEHDHSPKTFLGETGDLNGDDVVDVIARQPATARFLARHLYTFFVADEPPVASWNEIPPRDPAALDVLVEAYFASGGNLRQVMRVLFNSDFFKESQFMRVKSPTEHVSNLMKLLDTGHGTDPQWGKYPGAIGQMGQSLHSPISVEGWWTGPGWIDGGSLTQRVNFAVDEVGDATAPGIRYIVDRISKDGGSVSPDGLVEQCLELVGSLAVDEETRLSLVAEAEHEGGLRFATDADRQSSESRILKMLQLVVSTREYQFG